MDGPATFDETIEAAATCEVGDTNSATFELLRGVSAWFDESGGTFTVIVAGKLVVIFTPLVTLRQGTTIYFALGPSASAASAAHPWVAGTALKLVFGVDQDAGSGSYVVTLRKGTSAAAMADTGMTVTLTGTTRADISTETVTFSDLDWIEVKAQAVGAAPDAEVKVTLVFDPS